MLAVLAISGVNPIQRRIYLDVWNPYIWNTYKVYLSIYFSIYRINVYTCSPCWLEAEESRLRTRPVARPTTSAGSMACSAGRAPVASLGAMRSPDGPVHEQALVSL